MKKITAALLMINLMFFLALTAVGCAQTASDTMGGSNMETHMESKSDDTMDKSMDSMNEEKLGNDMEKPMDTMDAEKMKGSMKKDMQNDMK